MKNRDKKYYYPQLYCVKINLERGFAASVDSGFEQPEYGGEDNL